MKVMQECDVCGGCLTIKSVVEVGEIISCDDCGKEYEVSTIDPVKLVSAPEVEEDWGE